MASRNFFGMLLQSAMSEIETDPLPSWFARCRRALRPYFPLFVSIMALIPRIGCYVRSEEPGSRHLSGPCPAGVVRRNFMISPDPKKKLSIFGLIILLFRWNL